MSTKNPFACPFLGDGVQIVDAKDRVEAVKKFTLHECEAALQQPGLQTTVLRAIDRRMKQCEAARKGK